MAESPAPGGIKQLPLPLRLDEKHSIGSNDKKRNIIFTSLLVDQYREAIRESREAFKIAKNLSWGKFVFQINPKTTKAAIFQNVAILSGTNHKSAPIILKTENTIIPSTEIPEALARYFYNTSATHNLPTYFLSHKFISESRPLPSIDASDKNCNSLFSLDELDWTLNKCRGMSSVPDKIGYLMLQNLFYRFKTVLLQIYNNIWSFGNVPDDWKTCFTIPIPKPNKAPYEIDS